MHCNLEQLEVTRLAGPRSSTAATSTHPPFPIVRLVNHSAKVGCARGNVQCFQGASSAYQSSLVAATRLAKSVRSGSSTVCDLPPALRNPPPPLFSRNTCSPSTRGRTVSIVDPERGQSRHVVQVFTPFSSHLRANHTGNGLG